MRVLNTDNINITLVVILIILGSYFRLVDLGNPGFWGDEETSSIPAKSLALGQGARFITGMEYRRALPHTYLSAWSAKIWGIDKDLSYRVPSAVFGIATLLLIFLGTKELLGFNVALVATALLAFSEWHIILSRTARMYGPLLFFSTMFCLASLACYFRKTKQYLCLFSACIFYAIASTFNFLAITVLPILFLPLIFLKFDKAKFIPSLTLTVLLGIISILYFKVFLGQPYVDIKHKRALHQELQLGQNDREFESLKSLNFENIDIGLILLGTTIGVLIFVKLTRQMSFGQYPLLLICLLFTSLAYGLFTVYGAVYGIFICILFLLVFLPDITKLYTKEFLQLSAFLLIVPFLIIAFNLYRFGFATGLKTSLNYPFPYLLYQLQHFPGVIVLFFIGIVASLFESANQQSNCVKVLAVIVITPSAIFGLIQNWAPPRYFVTLYPLLIIVASYGLVNITEKIKVIHESKWLTRVVLLAFPVAGILGGHGIPQANAVSPSSYGAYIYGNHVMGIKYPDHRSHGCFVKQHLRDGDIVVAEDALQMFWYIGKVDYWLRTPSKIDTFLYLDGKEVKDIYVNSKPTSSEVIDWLRNNSSDRIWVITSGETQQYLDHFLLEDSAQRKWLDEITDIHKPLLTGRDGLSATYCINCDKSDLEHESGDIDCNV